MNIKIIGNVYDTIWQELISKLEGINNLAFYFNVTKKQKSSSFKIFQSYLK